MVHVVCSLDGHMKAVSIKIEIRDKFQYSQLFSSLHITKTRLFKYTENFTFKN